VKPLHKGNPQRAEKFQGGVAGSTAKESGRSNRPGQRKKARETSSIKGGYRRKSESTRERGALRGKEKQVIMKDKRIQQKDYKRYNRFKRVDKSFCVNGVSQSSWGGMTVSVMNKRGPTFNLSKRATGQKRKGHGTGSAKSNEKH